MLADETRYQIYRSVAERPGRDVTVADVAERFHLHPNVARMHLAKLEQHGLLVTSFRRSAGGGRPAKLYRLSEKVATFGFPPRRYELLARLALDSLTAGGTREDMLRVCREAGAAEGRRALMGSGRLTGSADEIAGLVRDITNEQGLYPEINREGRDLRVILHNCSFREASGSDPELVCPMHRAFLDGVFDAVTAGQGHLQVEAGARQMSAGGDRCEILCRHTGGETEPDAL